MGFMGACAHGEKALVSPGLSGIKTVYLWDADGHIDLNLLRGLKAAAAKELKAKGILVTDNASATDAYVKVTVIDASRNEDAGTTFVKARLYIITAADNLTLYDKTAQTGVKWNKEDAPAYPVEEEVKKLLSDYPASGAK